MPPPAPSPALLERAHTHRAAAAMLTKSPIWSLLTAHMSQKLAALEADILNNATLDAATLQKHRDERLFLRQTLTDFANGFRSAFTSPPPSEDPTLQKMAVPPEVEAALQRLITPVSPSPRLPVSHQSAPADPRNIDPFSGTPL